MPKLLLVVVLVYGLVLVLVQNCFKLISIIEKAFVPLILLFLLEVMQVILYMGLRVFIHRTRLLIQHAVLDALIFIIQFWRFPNIHNVFLAEDVWHSPRHQRWICHLTKIGFIFLDL